MGGLGNQMFQYAFGRNLSIRHSTVLKLDTSCLLDRSPLKNFTFRDYGLTPFNIDASFASAAEIKQYSSSRISKLAGYFSIYFPFFPANVYLREPFFHFFSKALDAPDNTYIDGYWQSEKYFRDISGQLRKDFTLKEPLSPNSRRLAAEISTSEAIGIHVRKKDYLSNFQTKKYYTEAGENYYKRAMDLIASKISNPRFFVFSDEPDWFRKNVHSDFPVVYVEGNTGPASYEDMYLMSLCKANIIANSTFSWWGAWLNRNEAKIIITPQQWFTGKAKKTMDLFPSDWIRI
jgi:hypothetical protein